MKKGRHRVVRSALPEPPAPPIDELQEAAELLPQQEPPETVLRARPPLDEADPLLIDPAD